MNKNTNDIFLQNQEKYQPTDITYDVDSGIHTASFDYYTGIHLMKIIARPNTGQSTFISYMVCCGDVMTRVTEKDYPNIKRRHF